MNKEVQAIRHDIGRLAEDARALIAATADVAGEKVGDARKRLAAALERGQELYGRVREQADETVHEHPYRAIGVALGVGALVGFLLARRRSRND